MLDLAHVGDFVAVYDGFLRKGQEETSSGPHDKRVNDPLWKIHLFKGKQGDPVSTDSGVRVSQEAIGEGVGLIVDMGENLCLRFATD